MAPRASQFPNRAAKLVLTRRVVRALRERTVRTHTPTPCAAMDAVSPNADAARAKPAAAAAEAGAGAGAGAAAGAGASAAPAAPAATTATATATAAAPAARTPCLVPPSFVVPTEHVSGRFRFVPLRVGHVDLDLAAVAANAAGLRSVFAEVDEWPRAGITREENLCDLARHEAEWEQRLAFAYVVLDAAAAAAAAAEAPVELGCVYINPPVKAGHDAEVQLWAVWAGMAPAAAAALDAELEAAVRAWVVPDVGGSTVATGGDAAASAGAGAGAAWPWAADRVCFPGRASGVPWGAAWDALPWRDEAVPRIAGDAKTVVMHSTRVCGLAMGV